MPNFMNNLVGTWAMNHDGWTGTLVINPSDQSSNQVDGNCTFHVDMFDGTWSGGVGSNIPVSGVLGGKDSYRRTGEACPESPHKLVFTISFPGAAPQPFEGYIFVHAVNIMAGYTWWQEQPFAWYAIKQ
jgi:hypothetical protein